MTELAARGHGPHPCHGTAANYGFDGGKTRRGPLVKGSKTIVTFLVADGNNGIHPGDERICKHGIAQYAIEPGRGDLCGALWVDAGWMRARRIKKNGPRKMKGWG